VNLCPTEPITLQPTEESAVDWRNLSAISKSTPGVTPSSLYFRLAIEANLHFINFTPNFAETPRLRALAAEKSLLYCGRDGKTGQTFLKTVLAPALRDRNLRIDGWYSTNLLGNDDGVTLADEHCRKTKQRSKLEALPQILGYQPGGSSHCHQVHIHYYPPRGDAKEAWDNIDFTGFLGAQMQLKLNWLGRDSLLAAPAVLDLVRLVCSAAQRRKTGLLHELSYFFKDPLTGPGHEKPIHSTPDQFAALLNFLCEEEEECRAGNHS
jgi:myo-inositol-1-phosphate synthase